MMSYYSITSQIAYLGHLLIYMNLEPGKIRTWKDLSEAFLNQYKYNLDMDPTILLLQNQTERSNETFKEYTQRWREMASRVRHSLSDTELVDIFMGTLQGFYYENMVGSSSSNFADIMVIGENRKWPQVGKDHMW